jgi:hypothetical protein
VAGLAERGIEPVQSQKQPRIAKPGGGEIRRALKTAHEQWCRFVAAAKSRQRFCQEEKRIGVIRRGREITTQPLARLFDRACLQKAGDLLKMPDGQRPLLVQAQRSKNKTISFGRTAARGCDG